MKITINKMLALAVAVLLLLCVASVAQPIRFQHERQRREQAVKQQLMKIRQAEATYLQRHGRYADNFNALEQEHLLSPKDAIIVFSGGQAFQLATDNYTSETGKQTPVMECSARYEQYLNGLNRNDIGELTQEAQDNGDFPGLKIGDLLTPNNNAGNWE